MKKRLKLSLIIPAYNEESHLKDCLDSISKQTIAPYEVIVVDNNSTDNTALIAKSFKFVKVVAEKEQGLIPARNRGFREASGDLLARLDADSALDKNWVKTVHRQFEEESTDAITGPALIFFEIHFPKFLTKFWSKAYFKHALGAFRFQVLWGPNMVIRSTMWQEIKAELCKDDKLVHEDQDISVIATSHGKRIKYVDDLIIYADGIRFLDIFKAIEYQKRKRNTLRFHDEKGTLKKARKNGINRSYAWLLLVVTLPIGILSGIFCIAYLLEQKLKNRLIPSQELE